MLETLMCETFADEPARDCIEDFFKCVEGLQGTSVHRPFKARVSAFIATNRDPHLAVRDASMRGFWNLDHGALEPVRVFLRKIADVHWSH